MEEELCQFISDRVLNGRYKVEVEDELLDQGMVDSMGVMLILQHVEERYHLPIPLEALTVENFSSVRVLANYLKKQLKT